jgi:hypothetical protein
VLFFESKLEFMCSCMSLEFLGIPYKHLFAVFVSLEIVNLHDTVILQRWTNSAKDSISSLEEKIINPSDPALVLICRLLNLVRGSLMHQLNVG